MKRFAIACLLSVAVLAVWAQLPNSNLRIPVWDSAFRGGAYRYLTPGVNLVINATGCTSANCGTIDATATAGPVAPQPAQEILRLSSVGLASYTLAATPTGPVAAYRNGVHLAPGVDYSMLVVGGKTVSFLFPADWGIGDVLVIDYLK